MDPSVLCLCVMPPALGAVAVAIMHLRKRAWWRIVPWILIPIVLLLVVVTANNRDGPAALFCVSSATLLVTVGLIFELRQPRTRNLSDETPSATE